MFSFAAQLIKLDDIKQPEISYLIFSCAAKKYIAENTRKQYEERGEFLPLQPNSNEVAANKSPIKNATVTTGTYYV